MKLTDTLYSRARMLPVLLVSIVIAVGAGIIILTTDGPGGSSAPAPTASGPAQGGTGKVVKVDIADFKFVPAAITVKKGSKVEWTNSDSAAHTATADDNSFDTDIIDQGKNATQTFDQPGTIAYHCDLHPFMTATLEVK